MEILIPPASPTPLSGGCTDPKSHHPQAAGDPANTGRHSGHLALVGAQRAPLDSLPDVTWIKNKGGVKRPVPIIACTANARASDAALCYQAGMNDYLPKPVSLGGLQTKIKQWLSRIPESGMTESPTPAAVPAQTPSAKEGALLNEDTLSQFTGGDAALRLEILQQFLESTQADVADLQQALAGTSLDVIRRVAHRAKGASRMVGAEAFSSSLETIEHAASAGNRAGVDSSVPSMQAEYERLGRHLKAELNG